MSAPNEVKEIVREKYGQAALAGPGRSGELLRHRAERLVVLRPGASRGEGL